MNLLNTIEVEKATKDVKFVGWTAPAAELTAYYNEIGALHTRWAAYLAQEYAPNFSSEFHNLLYVKSWHDNEDYYVIEEKYAEFVSIAKAAVEDYKALI